LLLLFLLERPVKQRVLDSLFGYLINIIYFGWVFEKGFKKYYLKYHFFLNSNAGILKKINLITPYSFFSTRSPERSSDIDFGPAIYFVTIFLWTSSKKYLK